MSLNILCGLCNFGLDASCAGLRIGLPSVLIPQQAVCAKKYFFFFGLLNVAMFGVMVLCR